MKRNEIKIIDVKYKKELLDSDRYQIGFYLHEYSDQKRTEYSDQKRTEGFAILPEYGETKDRCGFGNCPKHQKYYETRIFTATKTKIQIHEKRINVDEILKSIKNPIESKRKKALKNHVKDLITENKSGK